MTNEELKVAIAALDLSQVEYAALMCVSDVTVRRWIAGSRAVPPTTEAYTNLLLAKPDMLHDAWVAAGLPNGRKVAPRGRPKNEKK